MTAERLPAAGPLTWMRVVLIAAAVYNLSWGLWVVLDPGGLFRLGGIPVGPR